MAATSKLGQKLSVSRRQLRTVSTRTSIRRPVVAVSALKLYTNPASRGRIIEWYMQEKGIEAELVNLDLKQKEHKTEEFFKINPFGKVPVLCDGDLNLMESGAIMLYLADLCGETDTKEKRGRAAAWVLFANSTMANSAFVEQFRERSFPDVFGNLDRVLSETEYLEGEFSVSDVAVGAYLLYIELFLPTLDMSPYPHVLQYMDRLLARPACAATVGTRVIEAKKAAAEAEKAKAAAATAD